MSTEDTPSAEGDGTPAGTPATTGRSRRTSLVAASMAVAVVLAGGGVAYWSSSASGGGGEEGAGAPAKGGPPPLALGAPAKDPGPGPGIAPGEPDPSGTRYHAVAGLPGGPDSAPVYRPQGQIGQDAVIRLAKALDVAGKVRSEGGTWKVGGVSRDSRDPVLQVNKSGSGSWTYSRYGTPGGTDCAVPRIPGDGSASSPTDRPECPSFRGPGNGMGRGGPGPVSQEKAKQAVRPVLEALGQREAKLDAGAQSGAVRTVTANPVYGGLPTYGWRSDLQVGADGQVVGGSGQLAKPVKGHDYPVLSAAKTLERLNGERARPGQARASDTGKSAEVRGAVFGLAVQYVDGGPALVPSWLFTVRHPGAGTATSQVAHPAVHPDYLVPKKAPRDAPSQQPTKKPGGGQSSGAVTMTLESYALAEDGKQLRLRFWGGVCSDYSASADQSGKAVKAQVSGKDKKPGQVCVKMAKRFTQTVTLKEPLGDRSVVDASNGKAVPERK